MSEVKKQGKGKYSELLKARDYMIYLIANTISRFGDSLDAVVFSYLIYQITGSAALMATILGVNFLPSIILQPFTGVLVDYYSRKKIQFICNFGRAASVMFVIWMYMANQLEVYHLFIFVVINSTLESFQLPAGKAMIPHILEEEQYANGLALQETATKVAELVGTALAGGMIIVFGTATVLFIDVLTFVICGVMMLMLKYEEKVKKDQITFSQYFIDLKEGWSYLRSNKVVWNICLMATLINFFFTPLNSLQLPFFQEILELGPEALSVVGVSITLGMMMGSVIYPILNKKMKNQYIFVLGGVLIGALYGGLLIASLFSNEYAKYICLAVGAFIGGSGATFVSLVVGVLFAKEVNPEYMGRVSGVFGALSLSAIPLASFITAILVSYIDLSIAVLVTGVIVVMFFLFQLTNKYLQED